MKTFKEKEKECGILIMIYDNMHMNRTERYYKRQELMQKFGRSVYYQALREVNFRENGHIYLVFIAKLSQLCHTNFIKISLDKISKSCYT